jgi:AcrR family transcriptional regulator
VAGATDYVVAALDVLAETGSEGLTIATLCRRLEVTKGSFYHHFAGMPAFTSALLRYWEREHSERLIAISAQTPDAVERIGVLTDIAVSLPHAAESAIRAWARSSPEVAQVQARVDRRRERHLDEAFRAVGLTPELARLQARMALALLIGAQHRGPVRKPDLRAMFVRLSGAFLADVPGPQRRRLRAVLAGAPAKR